LPRRRQPRTGEEPDNSVVDFRYDAKRKNNPEAGLAAQGRVRETPRVAYSYDPHLPPELRFDPTGESDRLPELLEESTRRALSPEEAGKLAAALRQREPWLEWSGKREKKGFVVDPVALHIHERISAQAIVKAARRDVPQRDLFGGAEQGYREAVQFYQHDVSWSNRLILGDSLQVMASLTKREDLAGKVQMIYLDPPYGIRFASNFQSEIGKRDVKDKDADLTREPETIKAYRDTWTLGVHSYLGYLRDRLTICRELLTDSGSIFVQISDENLHRVRAVLDEVFGAHNAVGIVAFRKTTGQSGDRLPSTKDYLLWYARNIPSLAFHPLYAPREGYQWVNYDFLMSANGATRKLESAEKDGLVQVSGAVYRRSPLTSTTQSAATARPFEYQGRIYSPGKRGWSTNETGLNRLAAADRLEAYGDTLSFRRFTSDFPFFPISDTWIDTASGGYGDAKIYAVQTNVKVIQRCILMTTVPGDLVLDPTCGSGTTAFVAEQWGRRWITIDSSRVALSIARQRLLTSRFDQFRTKEPRQEDGHRPGDPANGFIYKTVPHITLRSIAQNTALDGVIARHQPILDANLATLNKALGTISTDLRRRLRTKLSEKERRDGKRAITDADRRRWLLPESSWQAWEVPFDADDDWPASLRDALTAYRTAWRAKMDEVDAIIAANAELEELVDQPEIVPGVVRVSGPFTVEAVMPAEDSLDDSPIESPEDELEGFDAPSIGDDPANGEAYLDRMRRFLLADGVRFPDNKIAAISRLDALDDPYLHAEGEWNVGDDTRRVAASFGPQHGPVTAVQVESALHAASRRGFDDVVFAGFSFDGAAQAVIQDDPNPRVHSHLAHIRPDVQMTGLLKQTPNSHLFTVFGTPRTSLEALADGRFKVTMEGVDIYNPVDNTITPTRADKVAAWFLDADYDGRTFCITHAFFPDRSAWDKLARALKGQVDEELFASLSGTTSPPFEAGEHRRCAIKVIDPRGNEVLRVHRLEAPGKVRPLER
jgi:adenine-specific DNA-methyltransferase